MLKKNGLLIFLIIQILIIISIVIIIKQPKTEIMKINNTVTDNPPIHEVTFEIDKDLIGRYVSEGDDEMYFEIFDDGKIEISLTNLEGHTVLNSDQVFLTAYYYPKDIKRNIITFHVYDGELHFPIGNGMAINFESFWTDYGDAFRPSIDLNNEVNQRFVKVN